MTSTRPRFFSLHKLLTLSLFLFVFTISIQDVFAQTVNPAPAFNAANPDKLMTCTPAGSRTNRTWNCTTIERNNPNQTIGDAEQTLRKSDGTVTCSSNQVLKNGKCEDKAIEGWCGGNGFNVMGCLSWLADMIVGNIVSLINGVLSWILSIAMYLLDLVIYITVVKFTQNFAELKLDLNPSGTLGGIGSGTGAAIFGSNGSGLIYYIWGMLRDFVNLLLLITIIYYAVHTMFQGFNEHRNKFLYLLIFSIVINFSLFFVKFAIDMSNILSLQAYTLMANPASFEDWKGFRQNASGGAGLIPNATLGDYLLNIASIGGAHKVSIAKDAAEQRINEGMKASWVYQVIVMFMYIGLIYIVFFLAGLLVLRAAAFLFAMLLAALLAADIFFNTFAGNKGGEYEFATAIKDVTDKIRDDFYEALIKGPVLFLFLFLVGVLSNAIFNQSLQAEITSISSGSEEFKVFGTAFAASLAIFLKFVLFFALTKVLFDKLGVMKFGDNSKLAKGSKAFSNFLMRNTVGRGVGAAAFAGRELISRRLAGGKIGQSLQNQFTKMQESKSTFGRLVGNRIGRFGNRAVAGVKDSSMDARASKRVQTLASNIAGAVFKDKDGKPIKINGEEVFGKSAKDKDGKGGYEALDAQAVLDANTELSEYIKTAQSGAQVDPGTIKTEITDKGKDKVDFGGGKFNEAQIKEILEVNNKMSKASLPSFSYGGVTFNTNDSGLFIKDSKTGLSGADIAIINSNKKLEEEKKKLQKKREGEIETKIRANVSTREGPGFTERAFDERTGATLSDENREKLAKQMEDKVQGDITKKNKEEREKAQKISTIIDFRAETINALDQVKAAIDLGNNNLGTVDTGTMDELDKVKKRLEKSLDVDLPKGNISDDDVKKFISNSTLHAEVLDSKRNASELLSGIFDRKSSTLEELKKIRNGVAASPGVPASPGLVDEYQSLLDTSYPPGTSPSVLISHASKKRAAKEKLEAIDNAIKTSYGQAQKIEDRISATIEKIEKLKAKPEEKH